jgi:hypothetical protein
MEKIGFLYTLQNKSGQDELFRNATFSPYE